MTATTQPSAANLNVKPCNCSGTPRTDKFHIYDGENMVTYLGVLSIAGGKAFIEALGVPAEDTARLTEQLAASGLPEFLESEEADKQMMLDGIDEYITEGEMRLRMRPTIEALKRAGINVEVAFL